MRIWISTHTHAKKNIRHTYIHGYKHMFVQWQADPNSAHAKQETGPEFSGLDSLASAAMMRKPTQALEIATQHAFKTQLGVIANNMMSDENAMAMPQPPQLSQNRKCELCNMPSDGSYGTVNVPLLYRCSALSSFLICSDGPLACLSTNV
jgi:hypothetical protein